MLCVLILYISDGTYSFKVDSERQILRETFHGNLILIHSQSFSQKSAERKSSKKYFF